jgi:flotillin
MAFAKSLLEEAEADLAMLGLMLDTLTIQNVTDDQGYLAAIGRRQSADLQRRARIAEASARAEAVITAANNQQQTALAQLQAQMQIAKAEAHRRQVDAESRLNALVAEQNAQVEALVAKAQAERLVQLARIEQVSRRLNADVVEPARAKREAMFLDARGGAYRVIEEGRARGSAIRDLAAMWVAHGDDARRVFLTQKLDGIVDQLTSLVGGVDIQSYSLIDGATAEGDAESATVKLARGVEQLKQAGLDVTGLLAPGTRPPTQAR